MWTLLSEFWHAWQRKKPIHIEDTVMLEHNISVLKSQAHMDKKLPLFIFNLSAYLYERVLSSDPDAA